MNAIIDNLQPHERALLFLSINQLKENAERQLSVCMLNECDTIVKAFAATTLTEAKQLQHKLFGDTFVEEIDYIKYFNALYNAGKPATNFNGKQS